MSSLTMTLEEVIDVTGGEIELVNGVTKLTGGNIGLTHYPIFNENYRDTLTGKIVDHYFTREIGVESVDMFQMRMRVKMNEIMRYYNKLYLSEQIVFDPLSTVDLRTLSTGLSTQNVTADSESLSNTDSTSGSRVVTSDTPQVPLSGNGDYATGLADSNGTSAVDSTGSDNSTSESITDNEGENITTGYQGVASELLMRYRDALLNIDLMIINELVPLFMLVWDTGNEYTRKRYYW